MPPLRSWPPPARLAFALVALALLAGLALLIASHWEWAIALAFVGGGTLVGIIGGEDARRAEWKRKHGRFLTNDDRNTLAAQGALSRSIDALTRFFGPAPPA